MIIVTAAVLAGVGRMDSMASVQHRVTLPPTGVGFDYQLGGSYPPPHGVGVVVRDRLDDRASGAYNVCYLNGFQTQADEAAVWYPKHRDLILRDRYGNPIEDPNWPGEQLLNIASTKRRSAIAAVMTPWIRMCADDGFDAVELDNLDSYTRSRGRLSEADAVAMAKLLAAVGHRYGLAVAQKNSAELVPRRRTIGFDFAIAEECGRYHECAAYTEGYGRLVYVVEYSAAGLDTVCRGFPKLAAVRRDRNLTTPSSSDYVRATCPTGTGPGPS